MRKVTMVLSVLAALLISIPAYAVTIDFGTGNLPAGGNVAISGDDVIGSGIPIGSLQVLDNRNMPDATVNLVLDSPWNIDKYYLSFNTDDDNNFIKVYGINEQVSFASVGGDNAFPPAYWELLVGTISSFTVEHPSARNIYFSATGVDSKNPLLLSMFDIDPNTKWSFFGFSFALTEDGKAYSTDISNTSVPEPTSLLLLGLGLMGVAVLRRKK